MQAASLAYENLRSQDLSEELVRWMSKAQSTWNASLEGTHERHSTSEGPASKVFVICAPTCSSFVLGRTLASQMQAIMPELPITLGGGGLQERAAVCKTCTLEDLGDPNFVRHWSPSDGLQEADVALLALTSDAMQYPLLQLELAWALGVAGSPRKRVALIYDVRSHGGGPAGAMLNKLVYPFLLQRLETVASLHKEHVSCFDYLDEFNEFCTSALLQWVHPELHRFPSLSIQLRLHSELEKCAAALKAPPVPIEPEQPEAQATSNRRSARSPKALAKRSSFTRKNSSLRRSGSPGSRSGSKKSTKAADGEREVHMDTALGIVHSGPRGAEIAKEVTQICEQLLPTSVVNDVHASIDTSESTLSEGRLPEHVANLLLIITPGCMKDAALVSVLERAARSARPPHLILLHDIHNVQSVWEQLSVLPPGLQTAVMSSVAVPWLDTMGFAPCLACMAGAGLFQPLVLLDDSSVLTWAAGTGRIFDILFNQYHSAGLNWVYSLRMSLVRLAGPSLRSVLDTPSTETSMYALGRLTERSRVHLVAVAPGFLTKFVCQQDIMLANSTASPIVFVQHMDSCIDLEEELASVQCTAGEFLSRVPLTYQASGGSAEFFCSFQKILFGQIWTSNLKARPPVFSFCNVLEKSCAEELLNNLRPGRLRRPGAPERFEHGVRAVHEFLQAGLSDCESARVAFALIANQLLSGIGEQLCIAMLRTGTMKTFSQILRRYMTPPIEGAIAHQALRALRALAESGSSATSAMEQLMDTHDTALAVKVMLEDAAEDPLLRPAVLEIAKVLLTGGSGMGCIIDSAGLGSFFKELVSCLRADLEPLELVREHLRVDPSSLDAAGLKRAVVNWQGSSSSASCTVPPLEVQEASLLLEHVEELQKVVISADGERATELLRDHLADLQRFRGIEELIEQAQAASSEFEAQQRFRAEQLQSKFEALEKLAKVVRAEELAEHLGPVCDDLFSTLGTHGSDLQFTKETFRIMQLIASSRKEVPILLAERGNAVAQIFSLLLPMTSRAPLTVSVAAGAARSAVQSNSLQTLCTGAFRLLHTLLIARSSVGCSYDRLFHRGVADNCATVASVMRCFPFSHDVQMEGIKLLLEVASADKEGARAVGDSLAPTVSESSAGSNLVLHALQRFHIDAADTTSIFRLAQVALEASHLFMGNLGPSMNIFVQQALRCINGHRDDADVECQALGVLVLLVATEAFNAAKILMENNGLEILLTVAARHASDETVTIPARTAIAQISKRCTSAFYNDFQAIVKRHKTSTPVVREVCMVFTYILQSRSAAGDYAEHVKLACKSDFLSGLLHAVREQRGQKSAICALPPALNLLVTLGRECGATCEIQEISFKHDESIVYILLAAAQEQLQDWAQQRKYAELAAAKDLPDWKSETAPEFLPAVFRSLQGLLSARSFAYIANASTIHTILQILCKTTDHHTLTAATSCLACIMRLVEEHVCMASLSIPAASRRGKHSILAHLAQTLLQAERHGFAHWRTGNFLLAAAEFRNAERLLADIVNRVRDEKSEVTHLIPIVEEHIRCVPFAKYLKALMSHQNRINNQTNAARTCGRVEYGHGDLVETEDECMICLRPLGDPASLWKCAICKKFFHNSPCMSTWRRLHDNCPHCRSECGSDRRTFDPSEVPAYNRARAVAVAAEECLKNSSMEHFGEAFLIATVASLWRTANGVGYRLKVPGTSLARDEQRAQELEERSKVGLHEVDKLIAEFGAKFVKPLSDAAKTEGFGEADTATVSGVVDALISTADVCIPFRASLAETWGRPALPRAGLSTLCSVAAIMRTNQVTHERTREVCRHSQVPLSQPSMWPLVQDLAHDRLAYRVAVFLEAKEDLPLLAATFLWRFQQCAAEAHDSVFSCIDMIMQALATPKTAENVQLRASLCRLVHDLIFVESRSRLTEERMLLRVQQEGSPREGATIEEWYVDTLLDSYGLSASRAEILMSVGSDPFESLAPLLDGAALCM